MGDCPFCWPAVQKEAVTVTAFNVLIRSFDPVLEGSYMIVPKTHRETVFDLTAEEWEDMRDLLQQTKERIGAESGPDGYNVGWNCCAAGGQTVPHAHLHIIPRFADEPLAGKGIRHHLKQESNRRQRGSN
ncbi:HIT family protein [Paenibacillus oceani]|uniref:HIT domain-containing protein n=1 Tax=Paenibacillus oceani TaxID=2772510 RepID=A0A927H152_9BACL|nr:HIT domain-containing protein [Paenibacillus oceani]MBD2863973.1 HIT domain-containing protein [Paenibacillus oceani]